MKRSGWFFVVFWTNILVWTICEVEMMPIHVGCIGACMERRYKAECRYHLQLHFDKITFKMLSILQLDGLEMKSLDSCYVWFSNGSDEKTVNKAMIKYDTDIGLMTNHLTTQDDVDYTTDILSIKDIFAGATVQCTGVTSCVTVSPGEEGRVVRRRLLALSHQMEAPLSSVMGGLPLGGAVASCGFLLIVITMLCACHDKQQKVRKGEVEVDGGEEEMTFNKVSVRGSLVSHNGTDFSSAPTNPDQEEGPQSNHCKDELKEMKKKEETKKREDSKRKEDVKKKEESKKKDEKKKDESKKKEEAKKKEESKKKEDAKKKEDGGPGHKRDDSRGSRCATLDRRLPAPPVVPPLSADDLDPTYDVIPGDKTREDDTRTNDSDSQSYEPINRIYAVPEVKKSQEILYEEVDTCNTRPESMMEDFMDRTSIMEVSTHSAHSVQSSKHSQYLSDSDDRSRSNMSNVSARLSVRSLEEHYASPDDNRLSSGDVTPTGDCRSYPASPYEEDYSRDPPPVPERRYGEDEISAILPEEPLPAYIPPRLAAAAFPLPQDIEVASPAMPTMPPQPARILTAPVITAVPIMDYSDPPDPRYIQVTARESLASIKARQALNRHDYDNFYEPIDGDDPPPQPIRPISPPRSSLDMYTADYDEISYASVPGNDDAELYSDIGDSPVQRVPPLHGAASSQGGPLMDDTSIIYADADSPIPDRRNRSMTTGAIRSTGAGPSRREPVYAVPNKERKRSRSQTQPSPGSLPSTPVYAVVDKGRKIDENENHDGSLHASASLDFDVRAPLANYDAEISFDKTPSNGSYEGVRIDPPEMRTPRPPEPPSDRTSVDSGLYQRVDIDVKPSPYPGADSYQADEINARTRYSNLCEDANYSIIPVEEKMVAREQMFHMSNHKVREDFWVKQEHVYQELDEDLEEDVRFQETPRDIPVTVL